MIPRLKMPGFLEEQVAWIQARVQLCLGVDEAQFKDMLNADFGKEDIAPAQGPHPNNILCEFLGPNVGLGSSLFFHTEVEDVQESQEYEEEYQEDNPIGDEMPVDPLLEQENDSSGSVGEKIAGLERDEMSKVSQSRTSEDAAGVEDLTGDSEERPPNLEYQSQTITKTRKAVRVVTSLRTRCRITQGNLPNTSGSIVFFIKLVDGEVPRTVRASDHESMAQAVEYGCLAGDCLMNLYNLIKEVFSPLLDRHLGLSMTAMAAVAPAGGDRVMAETALTLRQDVPKIGDNLRNEFRSYLHKFELQVSNATHQVKGDVHLSVPNINLTDPDIANDVEAVSLLEGTMEEWSRLIAGVVDAENMKRVKGEGPMAEIEFWRRRNTSLSVLYEQINMPKVTYDLSLRTRNETCSFESCFVAAPDGSILMEMLCSLPL